MAPTTSVQIHIGNSHAMEEAWSVGYRLERAMQSGAILLEFDAKVDPTPELLDVLVDKLREAVERGLDVRVFNMPALLTYALESTDGRPVLAATG
jgi:hypothetical protein